MCIKVYGAFAAKQSLGIQTPWAWPRETPRLRHLGLFTWRWGPQVGEVTCGKVPHLTCKRDHIKMRDFMDRRVTPSKRATSPTWGPPLPCKQALIRRISCLLKPVVRFLAMGLCTMWLFNCKGAIPANCIQFNVENVICAQTAEWQKDYTSS